jgi:polysaccharide deacetylase family protein (PEP-CTERM system associated)
MIPALLTFDIEDWFQVENLRPLFPPASWEALPRRVADATRRVLRLLAEHEIRSTFFVLGWVAEREPALVHEIAAGGHEIACHGYGHILPMQLTPQQFRDDVVRAKTILEEIGGQEVVGYRAPSFSLDRERLAILDDCGFCYDSSHHPFALHDRYGRLGDLGPPIAPGVYAAGERMVELELPVEHVGGLALPVSGGGYFRLYPAALFRSLVARTIARRGSYLMYLHSWEFDPGQPRVQGLGPTRLARHYVNLSRTAPRLRQLIAMLERRAARFMTASEFAGAIRRSVTALTQGRRVPPETSTVARPPAGLPPGDGLQRAPKAG